MLHGTYGEDGTIQGLLEMAGLPYVGSGRVRQRGLDGQGVHQEAARRRRAAAGRPRGAPRRRRRGAAPTRDLLDEAARERLGLPVFVKPARAGSSIGITKVTDWAQFPDAVATPRPRSTRR